MQTYPNNRFLSYWEYLSKTSDFRGRKWHQWLLRRLQTGVYLAGLILRDAGIEMFFLLLFWVVMTKMSQGRDLVVSFFEPGGLYNAWRVVITVGSAISLSVSMWLIPAFVFQWRDDKNKHRRFYKSIFKEHLFFVHRVLPLIPFWLLAYVLFHDSYTGYVFIGLSVLQVVLLLLFDEYIKEMGLKQKYMLVVLLLFVAAWVLFAIIYRQVYREAKIVFAVILYLLAFLMHYIYYRIDASILKANRQQEVTYSSAYAKYKLNSVIYTIVLGVHLISLLIIFALPDTVTILNIAPESMLLYIFSLNVFLIDLVVYAANITVRLKFIAVSVLVVVIAVYVSPVASLNLHHYTLDDNHISSVLDGRDRLTFADEYANLKQKMKAYHGEYPIVLISGEGGGSRAGLWFSQNLINFDIATNGRFRNHIFSLSTVSGSSVGLSTVLSFWKETAQPNSVTTKWDTLPSKVFANNFVGGSIRGLFLTDFWKTVFPGQWNWTVDRNSVLQYEESYYTQKACKEIETGDTFTGGDIPEKERLLSRDFMNFFYDTAGGRLSLTGNQPLVLINTCRSNDGRRGIFSPIKLSNDVFNDAIDINGYLYDSTVCSNDGKCLCNGKNQNISLGQACNFSELFPLFSAPAFIDSLGSFVDGGYHENSGLKTTLDVYEKLRDTLSKDGIQLYRIYIVYLKNGSTEKNLYKGFSSEPPLMLPLKALSSQPFEGSESYFEERARFVGDQKDPRVEYIEVSLNNRFILDEDKTTDRPHKKMEQEIVRDLKDSDDDTTFSFPLARWLSKSVIRRIKYKASLNELSKDEKNRKLFALLNQLNLPQASGLDTMRKKAMASRF